MSSKIDIELVLKNTLALVKSQMNVEIANMNTLKSDALVLDDINAGAFFFAELPEGAFNYKQFVVYGFTDNPSYEQSQEDNAITRIGVFFEVVAVDAGESFDQNVIYRLLRYSKVLENIFQKNLSKAMQGYGKLEATALVPSTLGRVDGKMIRSAGVNVVARITAR